MATLYWSDLSGKKETHHHVRHLLELLMCFLSFQIEIQIIYQIKILGAFFYCILYKQCTEISFRIVWSNYVWFMFSKFLHWQVQAIYLTDEVFTVDNGLLTPTMKLSRNKARNYFSKTIASLYTHHELNSSST